MVFFKSKEDKPFFDVAKFSDMQTIQKNFPIIQEEVYKNKVWLNWGSDDYDQSGHCQFLTGDWTICPIYFGNYKGEDMHVANMRREEITELLASLPSRFPATIALLKRFPKINFAALSRLHPKSKLAPHRHNNPDSLIFHLGLIIPPDNLCGLTIAGQTHLWTKPGDAVIFNDNLEHSAWNDSDEERIILYVDFLRPLSFLRRLR